MTRHILGLTAALALYVCAAFAQAPHQPNFTIQKVAKGVYAFIRKEPPSLWFNPNNGLIVGNHYAIVIDSNISRDYTREVLAAIRKITSKPVRYVINTHWHEDHIIGNSVYREAFPAVKFIAQRSTLTDLPAVGSKNREGSVKNGPGFIVALKQRVASGKDFAGKPLSDEAKAGYSSDADLVTSYLKDATSFTPVMPDILVDDHLELNDDGRKVEIMFLGRAHTAADIVVRLPKENVVFSGDLTVWPVPLIGSTSYPLDYGKALRKLAGLQAAAVIPGHGPVMHDNAYIEQMIGLLDDIVAKTTMLHTQGKGVDEAKKSIDLSAQEEKFCGASTHKRFVFENYVTQSATAAAYDQLNGIK